MKTIKLNKLIDNKTRKPIEVPKHYVDNFPFMESVVIQDLGRQYRKALIK